MPMDFPVPPAILSGDLMAAVHFDPDSDPNPVLEIDRDWWVRARWFVNGAFAPFLGGTWHVQVIVESMGTGDEKTLATETYPVTAVDNIPSITEPLEYSKWIHIPSHLMDPDPTKSIQNEGVYKLVLLLTYRTPSNLVGRIAGFVEGPLVQFYHFQV